MIKKVIKPAEYFVALGKTNIYNNEIILLSLFAFSIIRCNTAKPSLKYMLTLIRYVVCKLTYYRNFPKP